MSYYPKQQIELLYEKDAEWAIYYRYPNDYKFRFCTKAWPYAYNIPGTEFYQVKGKVLMIKKGKLTMPVFTPNKPFVFIKLYTLIKPRIKKIKMDK